MTAVCDPWRYAKEETEINLQAAETEQTATLVNQGRLVVVPTLIVTGSSVNLTYGSASWALSAGRYILPDLALKTGAHVIKYSGSGALQLTYREARL